MILNTFMIAIAHIHIQSHVGIVKTGTFLYGLILVNKRSQNQ